MFGIQSLRPSVYSRHRLHQCTQRSSQTRQSREMPRLFGRSQSRTLNETQISKKIVKKFRKNNNIYINYISISFCIIILTCVLCSCCCGNCCCNSCFTASLTVGAWPRTKWLKAGRATAAAIAATYRGRMVIAIWHSIRFANQGQYILTFACWADIGRAISCSIRHTSNATPWFAGRSGGCSCCSTGGCRGSSSSSSSCTIWTGVPTNYLNTCGITASTVSASDGCCMIIWIWHSTRFTNQGQ